VQRAQAGLSLIEVLVAIFILSVGLLGMLGTMSSSLRLAASSGSRSIAALQLGSIAEALRANPTALVDFAAAAASSTQPRRSTTASKSGPAPACKRTQRSP
jgi:type IV pilus assembly protein PilV